VLKPKNIFAKTAVEYFKKGYYQSNARGELLGIGAQTLGVKGEINDFQVYENLIKGLTPDGSKTLSQREVDALSRKVAVDCTFAAPKSVSLCALVGSDSRLIAAHDKAVKKVLEWMEREYATTRIGTGVNREVVKTGNMVIAKFNHIETRELDPHLHSHCLIMNMTQAPNGEWYSHLNDGIFRDQKLLGMMYQHYLAIEVQRLGYSVEWHEHGQFDIKGYTPEQLQDFSKRRQQILAVVGADASSQQKEWAQKKTRRDKELVSPEDLKIKWLEAAKALGIEIVKPASVSSEPEDFSVDPKVFSDAIAHCSEKRVAFRTQDIHKFILSHSLKTVDVEQIQPLIALSPELIRLLEKNGVRYTTQTAVGLELDTIRLMHSGQKSVSAITQPEVVEAHLEQMRILGTGS
jgi:conjugative relaxase-like TrwC/TraI family protein